MVKDINDWDENWPNMHAYAKIGAFVSSRLFVGHNHTFRDTRTDTLYVYTAC